MPANGYEYFALPNQKDLFMRVVMGRVGHRTGSQVRLVQGDAEAVMGSLLKHGAKLVRPAHVRVRLSKGYIFERASVCPDA